MAMLWDLGTWHRPSGIGRCLGASLFFALACGNAYGQLTYRDVHDFTPSATDGENSYSNVTFDATGNVHGTTYSGGANGNGMVWEITLNGKFLDQHDFGGTITNADNTSGPDGINPTSSVVFDSAGNMYGTAGLGGPNGTGIGSGMVWEITASGAYKDLHDFGGTVTLSDGSSGMDGANPYAGVSVSKSGNLYGTANLGGGTEDKGMVWEITGAGNYKDLHDFGGKVTLADGSSGTDGIIPQSTVSLDSSGDLFGTAEFGGGNAEGMIWEIESGGTYRDLHDFGGMVTLSDGAGGLDGELPFAGVTFDSAGNKFGVAIEGGGVNDSGMAWEITASGTYRDLHDFGGTVTLSNGSSGQDGTLPYGNLVIDSAGDLFGDASEGGGPNNFGMTWEITAGGMYKDLHDFGGTVLNANGTSGPDGGNPYGGITVDSAGNLYGTASQGGPFEVGLIWGLVKVPHVSGLSLSPTTIGGLGATTGTVTLNAAAPLGGWQVSLKAGASGYLSLASSLVVPVGSSSATFTITGLAQRSATLNMGIFASDAASSAEAILKIQGDSLTSLTLSPSQIKWTSGSATATVALASAAPPGGWIVNLNAGSPGYVNMPTSVTVPAGATATTFTITGNGLRYFTLDLGIFAKAGVAQQTATLVVAGDAVKSISLSPSTIGWSGTSIATINLVVAAPPGGWLVNTNAGASGYVSMPSSVTVPAGATSATFVITAGKQRSLTLELGIYANDGPSNQSATLTIDGDSVKSLTLNPSSISALGSTTATVTLASAAPPGGWVITLHPGASGYVSMPATLTVPAGATTATFTITGIVQHSSTINLGIFASDGNSSQEAILTIT